MDFERMNAIQRRLHNAACVLGADGDEHGFEQLQRDAIAEIERLQDTLKRQDKAHHQEVQEQVAAERGRWEALLEDRAQIHGESSRIYARLASAVRAGAGDIVLGQLLRAEVQGRGPNVRAKRGQTAAQEMEDGTE